MCIVVGPTGTWLGITAVDDSKNNLNVKMGEMSTNYMVQICCASLIDNHNAIHTVCRLYRMCY